MSPLIRFGGFELDVRAGELRRRGRKTRLQEQSLRVLVMLIERPGEVVAREEIQQRLWPNDTIVEFDHGINGTIRRLRAALGDSAEHPRFIETLARRGYRFIAPVEIPPVTPADASPSPAQPISPVEPLRGGAEDQGERAPLLSSSRYRIAEKLGGGGMGVVYKAQDTRLGRLVALKFLSEALVTDPLALSRFEREACAASALGHPNICTIFEFDQLEGRPFISMELVEGKTLDEVIGSQPLPVERILDFAMAVAEALEAAHSAGVIHRDIKPANVMITRRGQVKVLDFGLAKPMRKAVAVGQASPSSGGMALTSPGVPLGTTAYMSPEQARGEDLDERSDLFSLGSLLYEMSTGRQAFPGQTVAVIFDSILNRAPTPPGELNPALPLRLECVFARCLEKDRELRYPSAASVSAELAAVRAEATRGPLTGTLKSAAELTAPGSAGRPGAMLDAMTKPTSAEPLPAGSSVPRRLGSLRARWALIGVCLLVLLAALAYGWLVPEPSLRAQRYVRLTDDGSKKILKVGLTPTPLLSDGVRLYFSVDSTAGGYVIAQVAATGGQTSILGSPLTEAALEDISADGSKLLVLSPASSKEGHLLIQPLPEGTPQRLADSVAIGASWSPGEQSLVYAQGNTLYLAASDGTDSRVLARWPEPQRPYWPRWSPDGKRVRLTVVDPVLDSSTLWEVGADGSNVHPVLPGGNAPPNPCCGSWTPDGKYYVFVSTRQDRSDIWALPDRSWFRRRPHPVQLTSGPISFSMPVASKDGKRLYVMGEEARGELVQYDPKGGDFAPYLHGISATRVDFSRDGNWVTYVSYPDGSLWRSRMDGTDRLQLTYSPLQVFLPKWSPDGQQIAFSGQSPGESYSIYVVPATGGPPRQALPPDPDWLRDPCWSPDGKKLVFERYSLVSGKTRLQEIDVGTHQVSSLAGGDDAGSPRWSPDGRYLAALAADSQWLMLLDNATGTWSVLLKQHVGYPNWSHDGQYIYFDRFTDPPGIGRVRVSDRRVEQLVNLRGHDQLWTLDTWLGLAPDDAPLLLRDVSIEEVYALDIAER